ncbi:MAG: hypothetical protein QNJ12_07240 [Ilumatobacter sp.]|uniref:hypothetical protein n=1 Tax=Ilumatobacter sp. TaxID=1967498 RepID=UPI00261FDAAE|nr:hypothetical protein [Ilumatobacter sp.]MDJ0768572.1 hypothetical protein [Ilumatobacter sp.]
MTSAPGERAALLLTVRRAGSAPLISITPAYEPSSLQERLNTTSTAEAVAYISRWLEAQTSTLDEPDPE